MKFLILRRNLLSAWQNSSKLKEKDCRSNTKSCNFKTSHFYRIRINYKVKSMLNVSKLSCYQRRFMTKASLLIVLKELSIKIRRL